MDDGQTCRTRKVAENSNGLGKLFHSFLNFFLAASPQVIAAHILSSISTIVFIIYFFWKPTNKFIHKQKEKLDQAHYDLASATKETKAALSSLQERRQVVVNEHNKFLSEKDEKEKQILETKMEEAEREKLLILKDANLRAKEIEIEAKRTVNDKIISLSIELAEKLIRGSINKKVQSQIIGSYLNEIDTAFRENQNAAKMKPS